MTAHERVFSFPGNITTITITNTIITTIIITIILTVVINPLNVLIHRWVIFRTWMIAK